MIYSETKKRRKEEVMQQNDENQHGLQKCLMERQVSVFKRDNY